MRLLRLAIVALIAIPLVACATKGGTPSTAQDTANEVFVQACFAIKSADLAFGIASTIVPDVIDANAIRWETTIMAGLAAYCSGPPPNVANTQAIVNSILDGAKQIQQVVAAARARAPGPSARLEGAMVNMRMSMASVRISMARFDHPAISHL